MIAAGGPTSLMATDALLVSLRSGLTTTLTLPSAGSAKMHSVHGSSQRGMQKLPVRTLAIFCGRQLEGRSKE